MWPDIVLQVTSADIGQPILH